jgi:hypothetical protein
MLGDPYPHLYVLFAGNGTLAMGAIGRSRVACLCLSQPYSEIGGLAIPPTELVGVEGCQRSISLFSPNYFHIENPIGKGNIRDNRETPGSLGGLPPNHHTNRHTNGRTEKPFTGYPRTSPSVAPIASAALLPMPGSMWE